MSDRPWIWVLAVLQVTMGATLGSSWIGCARRSRRPPGRPGPCDDHEAALVVADSATGVVLAASALLIVLDEPLGASLALVGGGMTAVLGFLGAAHLSRTGRARQPDAVTAVARIAALLVLAALLVIEFA